MSLLLADIFTDHMVLQRDCIIPIWGQGKNGSKVTVIFCDEVVECIVTNNNWSIHLSPKEAGGPFHLIVSDESNHITLKNILIGDVFIAGGQSNMEFELQKTKNGEIEVQNAIYPTIRYYQVPKMEFENPDYPKSNWTICSPQTAGLFSAVAYHFAKNLRLDVPIGIIGCNWGGTSASCWMSREVLEQDDDIMIYITEYEKQCSQFTLSEYEERRLAFIRSQEEHWLRYSQFKTEHPDVPEHLITTHIGDWPWPPPMGPKSFLRPAGLYYTMLKKITPFGIKAVLWYQGETDTSKPKLYEKLLTRLIENWRVEFNQMDLPFLIVQLPGYGSGNPKNLEYAILRESQEKVSRNVKDTGLVVTIDCGELDDIHPTHKEPIGIRLALLAKSMLYHQDLVYSGPVFKAVKHEKNQIILTFDHIGDGLTMKGEKLKGFYLSGEDYHFIECDGVISGDTIVLNSEGIKNPVYIRYGFENYPELNVYNKNGFPLRPFRTDV